MGGFRDCRVDGGGMMLMLTVMKCGERRFEGRFGGILGGWRGRRIRER